VRTVREVRCVTAEQKKNMRVVGFFFLYFSSVCEKEEQNGSGENYLRYGKKSRSEKGGETRDLSPPRKKRSRLTRGGKGEKKGRDFL